MSRGTQVEVQVRMDLVTVWQGNRTLAVLQRSVLAAWLWQARPPSPLGIDDIVLSYEGPACLSITIDGRRPCHIKHKQLLRLAHLVGNPRVPAHAGRRPLCSPTQA
ncbi:hypothetical protein LWF15_35060 [Kineosporia rhizophila]|uniref:hypothetical protein n=1 Tax=Kineosporia rhizophila TaxID=84633 RepID=UPI000A974D53|nr:hypothetical protein [Kineosporia rhizophila]MCE0540726.1 hypothetical protein [Kineosporia rhizophila]